MHQEFSVSSALTNGQNALELVGYQKRLDKSDVARPCNDLGLPDLVKWTCRNQSNDSKRLLTGSCFCKGRRFAVSMRKAFSRCAGAFAADCTALCCCPCAIISILAWVLVEIPYAIAKRMITNTKNIHSLNDFASRQNSSQDYGHSIFAFPRSALEPHKGGVVQAVHIFGFDTENLMKHFDAEYVGFGSLSLQRE